MSCKVFGFHTISYIYPHVTTPASWGQHFERSMSSRLGPAKVHVIHREGKNGGTFANVDDIAPLERKCEPSADEQMTDTFDADPSEVPF